MEAEAFEQLRESIEARNAEYEGAPAWRRRQILAQEVLDMLEAQALRPVYGIYSNELHYHPTTVNELARGCVVDRVRRVVVQLESTCRACALGSLALSLFMMRGKEQKALEARSTGTLRRDIARQLSGAFSEAYLDMLECLFEMDSGYDSGDDIATADARDDLIEEICAWRRVNWEIQRHEAAEHMPPATLIDVQYRGKPTFVADFADRLLGVLMRYVVDHPEHEMIDLKQLSYPVVREHEADKKRLSILRDAKTASTE